MNLDTTLIKTRNSGWIISNGLKFLGGGETLLETYERAVLHEFIKHGDQVYIKHEDNHIEIFPPNIGA